MTYRQLRLKDRSISYVCVTSHYTIPWDVDDPTTVHAEIIKGEEILPLEYGEEFTVDRDEGVLSLLINYNENDSLHIFEGEKLKHIAKPTEKHNTKTLTRRIDDCMEEIHKITPKIDKVEKEFKEEIKNLKTESYGDIELLKTKIEDLISAKEVLKRFEEDIAEFKNKPPVDLTPVETTVKSLEKKTDNIEHRARNLTEVVSTLCQKVDNVDIIQVDKDVTALASKSVEATQEISKLQSSVKEIESLKQEIESLKTKNQLLENNLASIPKVDLTSLENRIKELEPLKEFNSVGQLVLQATGTNEAPNIIFKDEDGRKRIALIFALSDALVIGRISDKDELDSYISLAPNKLTLNGKTIQEHIRDEIRGRTAIRCAALEDESRDINDVVLGRDIKYWAYPSENSGGYLSHSGSSGLRLGDKEKAKSWNVIGKTQSYYAKWHWLQEVIE